MTPAMTPKGRRSISLSKRNARLGWYLSLPTLLVIVIVALYPAISTIFQSFTDQTFGAGAAKFIGFRNFTGLFQDSDFWSSVKITIGFTTITVAIEGILGLALAMVLNQTFFGRTAMRAILLIPFAIINVISTSIWKLMFNQTYGVFNDILVNKLHLVNHPIDFFGSTTMSLMSVSLIDIWKTTPFVALLLLAGLQQISPDVYEAAQVDGASAIRRFVSIILPLLRPALLVALVFRTLDALRVFDVFYILFGNRADMTTMAMYIQENVVSFGRQGYGSAISLVVMIFLLIFVSLYVALNREADDQ